MWMTVCLHLRVSIVGPYGFSLLGFIHSLSFPSYCVKCFVRLCGVINSHVIGTFRVNRSLRCPELSSLVARMPPPRSARACRRRRPPGSVPGARSALAAPTWPPPTPLGPRHSALHPMGRSAQPQLQRRDLRPCLRVPRQLHLRRPSCC